MVQHGGKGFHVNTQCGLLAFLYCQKTPAPEEAKKEWGVLGSRRSSQSLEAVQGAAANKERGCPESQSWTAEQMGQCLLGQQI